VTRLWVGASGAKALCALGAMGRGGRTLNFTVRLHSMTRHRYVMRLRSPQWRGIAGFSADED